MLNNVLIRDDRGSTQIDHVIVSRYGLFCVETKDKTGWIFGDEKAGQWTQVIYGKKYRFQNPLRQNFRHTKSLSELLHVEHEKIFSLVIFWDNAEFKTPMPDNVVKGGIFNGNVKRYIDGKRDILLTTEEVERICSTMKQIKDDVGFLDDLRHAASVSAKYNSETACPKCGGEMVKRVSNRGANVGKAFLGCSNFPKCRYIKDI